MPAPATQLAARPRRARAGVTVAVVACVAAGCTSPEPLKLRSSQPLPDLSGLAWMGDDLLLAVHDAKNPVELDRPRISLLSPPASLDGVLWQPLEVSFPGEKSSDLEGVARIPNTSRLLMVESGDDGSGHDRIFLGELDGHLDSILGETRWSAFTEVGNVEATAVHAVSPTELLFVWGERNQGETGTDIGWAPLALEPFSRAGHCTQASRSCRASVNTCAVARARSISSPLSRCSRSLCSCALRTSLAVRACRKLGPPAASGSAPCGSPLSRSVSRTLASAATGKAGAAERAAAAKPETRPLPKLTGGERQLLVNIARNLMTPVNGAEPASLDEAGSVWRDCLDQGPETIASTSLPGLVASLTKKGLATTNGESVSLTPLGFAAYRSVAAEAATGAGETTAETQVEAKPQTRATLIAMLRRPEDADLEEIAEATAWQKHTIRGAYLQRPQEEARPRGHLD